jgi:4-amino-4-deoxy-L-arabinose transferase-like glycosyltransferase
MAATPLSPTSSALSSVSGFIFGFAEKSHARACALLLLACLALFAPGFTGLPPMDRDEPRFAQATRQMLETGDYVAIRFQGEARNKKPVGIYWMQAGIVASAEALGIPAARATIALYRIPSLVGAVLAVLLTYAAGIAFTTRRAAFVAAMLVAATILLGVEARLAKTDAAVTATVAAAMAVLARAWFNRDEPGYRLGWGAVLTFWIAIGIGILVKGPITPAIPALAALVLAWSDRSAGWLKRLRPWTGLAVVLVVVLPWFIAIGMKTGGAFFSEAVGQDMLAKVGGGQEAHGAPPGTYLAAFLATGWPLAPFLLLALPFAWRRRGDPEVLFCLAWAIPMWIVFEAVPTKLPHYVLPLYPALALLVGLAAERQHMAREGWVPRVVMGWLPALALVLLAAVGGGVTYFEGVVPVVAILVLLAALGFAVVAWFKAVEGQAGSAALAAAVTACLVAWGIYAAAVPLVSIVRISPRLAAAAAAAPCTPTAYATAGYREPSLVFLTRTDLAMTDGPGAAQFLAEGACRIAFVDKRMEQAFIGATIESRIAPRLLSRVDGVNLNGGRRLDIGVYLSQ